MKLYFAPGACSLSPHIALLEAGLPFEAVQVDGKTKKLTKSGADFWAINPKGQVPVLELDDGDKLTEGPAIVQYIADQAPASGLMPKAGTKERYKLLEWLNFITSELHKGFTPLFYPNTPDDYKPIVKENLAKRFALIDKALAGKDYLLGTNFSVADGYLFTVLSWSKHVGIDLSSYANISAFMTRMAARPKVHQAMKDEGLIAA